MMILSSPVRSGLKIEFLSGPVRSGPVLSGTVGKYDDNAASKGLKPLETEGGKSISGVLVIANGHCKISIQLTKK